MPISEYLLKLKNLIDALRYAGYIFTVNDHIMYILFGLGLEYDLFVMTVTSKIRKIDAYIQLVNFSHCYLPWRRGLKTVV